jgi:hypothetical protein
MTGLSHEGFVSRTGILFIMTDRRIREHPLFGGWAIPRAFARVGDVVRRVGQK